MSAVRQLRQKRDMSINEIKLTLAIEDPTTREKRDYLGIEVADKIIYHAKGISPNSYLIFSYTFKARSKDTGGVTDTRYSKHKVQCISQSKRSTSSLLSLLGHRPF